MKFSGSSGSEEGFCEGGRIMDSLPVFSSGIIISIIVFLSFFIYKIGRWLKNAFLYIFTTSFEVTGAMRACGDDLHEYTIKWLYENIPDWRHYVVTASSEQDEAGKISTKFLKPPAFDSSHYLKWNGVWIQIIRRRLASEGVICDEIPFESLTFRTLKIHGWALKKILEEIQSKFRTTEADVEKTRFFYACDGSYWREFGNGKRKRPLNSVILNEKTLSTLVDDVKEFLDSEEWYRDRGIPYRRGYLLYGPPGNGKSSFVKAIAGEFGYNICILSLSSSKNMNDDSLNDLMNTTEEKSIILLEDIDAAFPARDITEEDEDGNKKSKRDLRSPEGEASSGKVTLRGLLNALDGVASTEGRIVFLTTNHVEKLDPAMTRPGRVDMKINITLPNDQQLGRMFERFYPNASEVDKEHFIKVIRSLPKPVSMAMVQGLFMLYKHNHTDSITNAPTYFDEQFFSLKATSSID